MSLTITVDREKVDFDYMPDERLAERILPYGVDVATVESVTVEQYRTTDFGPVGSYTLKNGETFWVTFPGGFRHSGLRVTKPSS